MSLFLYMTMNEYDAELNLMSHICFNLVNKLTLEKKMWNSHHTRIPGEKNIMISNLHHLDTARNALNHPYTVVLAKMNH